MHPHRWFRAALTTAMMMAGMCIVVTASYRSSPTYAGAPGASPASCAAPIAPVTLVNPTVLTTCTQAALQAALTNGGHITFDRGPNPVTIPITSPLVTSATRNIVICCRCGDRHQSGSAGQYVDTAAGDPACHRTGVSCVSAAHPSLATAMWYHTLCCQRSGTCLELQGEAYE